MKYTIYKILMTYGTVESLIERNISPPLEYWRVKVYDVFHSCAEDIVKNLSRRFDTYLFRVYQTQDGVFILIYKKRL